MKTVLCAVLGALSLLGAQDVAGEYRARVPEVATALLLKADHSFEYFFTYGAADYTAKGTWRLDKDAVVLTTTGKEEAPFRLVKSGPGGASGVRVHVKAPNGAGVQHIDVALKTASGVLEARTDGAGVAEFPPQSTVKSVAFHIPVYDVDAGPFELPAASGEFWFEINGDAITQVRFREERLRMVDGALEMTFWKGDQPLRYKKR